MGKPQEKKQGKEKDMEKPPGKKQGKEKSMGKPPGKPKEINTLTMRKRW